MTNRTVLLTLVCTSLLAASAYSEVTMFDLAALDHFAYPEGGLVARTPGVKTMLIQVEAHDSRADITESACSADVTVNRDNTALRLTYQQAARAVMTSTVTPGKRQIML